VWAGGDDVTCLLTLAAKTLNRAASQTVRKSMHGAAISDQPVFWHMGAQILARSGYCGDVLCPRPCHGREHLCLARLDKHINEKIDFLGV
jgi:hypothetical protein